MKLESFSRDSIFSNFNRLLVAEIDSIIIPSLTCKWNYLYSFRPNGYKYKSKNVIFQIDIHPDFQFMEVRNDHKDTVSGNWEYQNSILTMKFTEPYYPEGKPENLEYLDDYSKSLLYRDNEIYFLHRITDEYLVLMSTVKDKDGMRTIKFNIYKCEP